MRRILLEAISVNEKGGNAQAWMGTDVAMNE